VPELAVQASWWLRKAHPRDDWIPVTQPLITYVGTKQNDWEGKREKWRVTCYEWKILHTEINLLKPTSYYMYRQIFNTKKKLRILLRHCVPKSFPYSAVKLAFLMEAYCVPCEIRTEYLFKAQIHFKHQTVNGVNFETSSLLLSPLMVTSMLRNFSCSAHSKETWKPAHVISTLSGYILITVTRNLLPCSSTSPRNNSMYSVSGQPGNGSSRSLDSPCLL
jgi:hypothetical protein